MVTREEASPETAPGSGLARPRWYSHRLNRLVYYRVAAGCAAALPRPARLCAARAMGRAMRHALPRERAHVRSNLARVLAGAEPSVLDAKVAETFANFAASFADLLTINREAPERLRAYVVAADGEEHLDAAFEARRGVVLLTAHLGNWELGGRLLTRRADRMTHVVLSAEQDGALERYLRLDGPRLRFVTRRHATSTLGLLAALRRNELVAMQGDRPTGGRGDTRVPFFGSPAAFPIGPFVLARAAGTPVVPAFCTLARGGGYRITIEPAIWVKAGEERAALTAMVGALERAIVRCPTQWFNFFDVWGDARAAA
jgi:lauroyl/myristoyl acyltransferase